MTFTKHRLALTALTMFFCLHTIHAQVILRTTLPSVELGQPIAPPPVPMFVPSAPLPPVAMPRLMTVSEFASTFKAPPGGGLIEVVLQHPYTCQPVKVCFRLPGCPRRVVSGKSGIVFRYGLCKAVTIRFYPDGGVSVKD